MLLTANLQVKRKVFVLRRREMLFGLRLRGLVHRVCDILDLDRAQFRPEQVKNNTWSDDLDGGSTHL
jgi:hypothetical protein